jgi:nitroreductase
MNQTQQTLHSAAETALAAPSIFNSQPWSWTVRDDQLELRADRSRQIASVDPDGRLLIISCGVAVHHALVAISSHVVRLNLLPDGRDADLVAVLRLGDAAPPDRRRDSLRLAITARRSDRRPFRKDPIEGTILDRLATACHEHSAHLYLVPWSQMPALALAAVGAGALQLSDPNYRADLAGWTHRPPWSGDGVPLQTDVETTPRRVPVRDFAPSGGDVMPAGLDNDYGAAYGIIHTDADTITDWLAAGMGLSAVLLTATAAGLGTATISDVTEAPVIRGYVRQLLPSGQPQVAVRVGHPQPGQPPSTPRRPSNEVITVAIA